MEASVFHRGRGSMFYSKGVDQPTGIGLTELNCLSERKLCCSEGKYTVVLVYGCGHV